ncbi:MAG: hypothetical protein MJZ36_01685 [Bacteroidaceae bacterium]|nr:hypothetical protein [Bacteroidaceae bacterium]
MNKKFLTAFLFGATLLASTSTFVSCKDYDDDIKDVQEQVNKEVKAREALEKKVAAAEQAIGALQTAVDELKNHEKDCDAAQATVNAEQAAAITAQAAALEAAKNTLQAAIDAQATKEANDVVALNAAIDQALISAKAYTDAAAALKADKTDLDQTNAKVAQIQTDLGDLITKYNSLSDDLTALKADLATKIAALEAQDAVLAQAIKDGDNALSQAIKDGDAANAAAIKDVKDEVVALATALKAADKALEEKIKACAEECKGNFDAINGTLVGLKNDIKSLQTDVEGIKNTVANITDEKIPEIENKIKDINAKIEVISTVLSNALRSLVFIPHLYVDGIEATRYRVYCDTTLVKTQAYDIKRQRPGETYEKLIKNIDDWRQDMPGVKPIFCGPTWPVEYHLNPSTATTAFADIKGFNVLEPEVITRANPAELGVTAQEKYHDGTDVFSNKNGILTVGIKVAKPELLFANGPKGIKEGETGKISDGKDNTVALQAKAPGDTIVTSDYALLYGTKVFLEGIVWKENVGQTRPTGLANKIQDKPLTNTKENSDELTYDPSGAYDGNGGIKHGAKAEDYLCGKHIHVWDTPEEALLDNTNNLVELYYNNRDGITLENYLALHWYEENATRTGMTGIKTWEFTKKYDNVYDDLKKYGINYEFEFVDYVIDGNGSRDSQYASLDKKNGKIIAQNVKVGGEMYEDESATSVGREPLVRVLVKHDNDVVLDGYILVHITKVDPKVEGQNITIPFDATTKFDLCNGADVTILTWDKFSKTILTDSLKNMTKEYFDDHYGPAASMSGDAITDDVLENTVWPTLKGVADGDWLNAEYITGVGYKVKASLYKEPKADAVAYKDTYGTVYYYHNESNTTNERVVWSFTADELEALTHDEKYNKEGSTYTAYIRWTGHDGAPYDYIWLKMTVKIVRDDVTVYSITEKIENYWFALDGNKEGYDAIVFNPVVPVDNGTTYNWTSKIRSTFRLNEVFLTQGGKLVADDKKLDDIYTGPVNPKYNVTTLFNTELVAADFKNEAGTNLTKAVQGAKFYFTPEEKKVFVKYTHEKKDGNYIATLLNKNYIVSPQPSAIDITWKSLYAKYAEAPVKDVTVHSYDAKTSWEEFSNGVINKCVIDYYKGAFANVRLYAHEEGKENFTHIATMNPSTGEISLVHNQVTYDVLNAIGYSDFAGENEEAHPEIDKELRAQVGVVAYDRVKKCVLAAQMTDATFLTSWQRPINWVSKDTVVLDSKTNHNKIYLADLIKFYDWRGYEHKSNSEWYNVEHSQRGSMELPNTKWLYAYYNIKAITVDCTPSKVYTNMHGLDIKTTTLDKVSPEYAYIRADKNLNKIHTYTFDFKSFCGTTHTENFNKVAMSEKLFKNMNEAEHCREKYGYVYYENNGDDVNEFDVIFPVTVTYEWGQITTNIKLHIIDTLGHQE